MTGDGQVDGQLDTGDSDATLTDATSDIPTAQCNQCHGDSLSAAPPTDTSGNIATTATGVGAHRSHLAVSGWHHQITCDQCHLVPSSILAPGHVDTPLPAELTWGDLAIADGASPAWNGTTCANTYCHGTTLLPGGRITVPEWTLVDGSQNACGTCHGIPPGGSHPVATQCSTCHPTVDAGLGFPDPSLHINGVVDLSGAGCSGCHGDSESPAPPQDTTGGTATTERGVGAHRSHLAAADWHRQVVCSDCHLVPTSVSDVGHTDTPLPAELTFGTVATSDGASPSFDGTTCSTVYCHGATLLPGGTNNAPVWTTVDDSQAACGACHSLPPGGTHPASTNCEGCHGEVIGAGNVFVNAPLHIDGIVEVAGGHPAGWADPTNHGVDFNNSGPGACTPCHGPTLEGGSAGVSCDSCHGGTSGDWTMDCTFCHGGSDNQTGAPPFGIDGETARGSIHVGAHTEHVGDTALHLGFACDVCHEVPVDVFSTGHVDGDGVAEVNFDAASNTHRGTYNGAGSCTNLYCHGNGRTNNGSATWTDNLNMVCTSCHGNNMSGEHAQHIGEGISCSQCHAGTASNNSTISNRANHVNGSVEVSIPSWNGTSCSPACHGSEVW